MDNKQTKVFAELSNKKGNAKNLTVCETRDAQYIYNNVRTGGVGTTVQKDVAEYFRKSGYKVETNGIGWRVTL